MPKRTSDPSKMGTVSEARLSPEVASLVGLLSTWSNSIRTVTPGLSPNKACCAAEDGFSARRERGTKEEPTMVLHVQVAKKSASEEVQESCYY